METKQKPPVAGNQSRRDFLKKTASATAAVAAANAFKTPVYGQTQAPSTGRVIGANDRIIVAYVGVGRQGSFHVSLQQQAAAKDNIAQAAVCDLSKHRVEAAKKAIGGNCAGFHDYRKLLERKDIDAVTVATVDHWHTQVANDCMLAGKDVYVEKPMTRYFGEAFVLAETVQKTGRVLQVGTQGCTDAKYHKAAEVIQKGGIGKLVLGEASYMRNDPKGEWNYNIMNWATPEDIDWNFWEGKVHKRIPFSADHYFRWRKYYPYCSGLLSDLVPHKLLPLMLASGNPEFPSRVAALGNKKFHTDRLTPGTPERDSPEFLQVIVEFPSGYNILILSDTVNETGLEEMIRGQEGNLYFGGNHLDLKPERMFADEIDPETFPNLQPSGESIPAHEANWFSCIRTRKLPNANIHLALRAQVVIALAEMAQRLNCMCLYDEKTRRITTDGGTELTPLTYGTLPLS